MHSIIYPIDKSALYSIEVDFDRLSRLRDTTDLGFGMAIMHSIPISFYEG